MYSTIRPGRIWLDTNGERIQAHGGSIIYVDGTYYWYGENKKGITGRATGEKCKDWHHGVSLYSSKDLYNWENKGVIMIDTDPNGLFYPSNIMDRPHILYCENTKKFVLWAKCAPQGFGFNTAVFGICVSDSIEGPFTYLKSIDCAPYHVGDFDMVIDGDEAYVIFEHPHTKMISWKLAPDYLDVAGEPKEHLPRPYPPFTREAPAHFKYNGKHYLITSGTTGYYPNPSELHSFDDFQGEWVDLGDPCIKDEEHNSFHAQFSSVFKVPNKKNLYIALGDRWLTDLYHTPDMADLFEREFNPNREPLPKGMTLDDFTDENTGEANYVWLPILFDDNDTPCLCFKEVWKIEDYE